MVVSIDLHLIAQHEAWHKADKAEMPVIYAVISKVILLMLD
jgi:hypothetical protein